MANTKDFKVKNGIQPTAYHEGLGTVTSGSVTVGYKITSVTNTGSSFDVTSQASNPRSVTFKPDGTKMYIMDISADAAFQYSLSTAWDLSTASYDSVSFSVSSQETTPYPIIFNNDGSSFYTVGNSSDRVYQYTCSTAYDLSTASYANKSFSVSSQDQTPFGLLFNDDGTKMYVLGLANNTLYQYSLSTAFDVSTASYDSKNLVLSSQDTSVFSASFNDDGKKLFVIGSINDTLYQYSLTTAYDIGTASYDNISGNMPETGAWYGFYFAPDGESFFTIYNNSPDFDVVEYSSTSDLTTNTLDLSTGSVFEITPTSDVRIGLSNPADSGTASAATLILKGSAQELYSIESLVFQNELNISSLETTPRDIKFNNDGTKLYVCGSTSDKIHQYSLAKPYDISTASNDGVNFSFSSQDATPDAFVFKPDGTKLYVVGQSTDTVYQYSLSTAYDVSTASYDSVSFAVTGLLLPVGIEFNDDGTKLFLLDNTSDTLYEYGLSTAYDISTASSTTSLSVSQAAQPHGFTFNADGTKLFVVDQQLDSVLRWSLTTGFDLTTASYDNVSADLYDLYAPSGVIFTPTGSKMFSVGYGKDSVYEFISEDLPTITYDSSVKWGFGGAPTLPPQDSTADVITFTTRDGGTSYKASLVIDGAA